MSASASGVEVVSEPPQPLPSASATATAAAPLVRRLAILECDTPIDAIRAKYGSYGDVFEALLLGASASAEDAGAGGDDDDDALEHQAQPRLEISKWDVVTAQEYPDPRDVDGVLVTGSRKF